MALLASVAGWLAALSLWRWLRALEPALREAGPPRRAAAVCAALALLLPMTASGAETGLPMGLLASGLAGLALALAPLLRPRPGRGPRRGRRQRVTRPRERAGPGLGGVLLAGSATSVPAALAGTGLLAAAGPGEPLTRAVLAGVLMPALWLTLTLQALAWADWRVALRRLLGVTAVAGAGSGLAVWLGG